MKRLGHHATPYVLFLFNIIAGWAGTPHASGQAQITTSQYNNARTGADLSETTLNSLWCKSGYVSAENPDI
jgi:hypothetical protein